MEPTDKTKTEEKKKIDAKPLPVDKKKAEAIEKGIEQKSEKVEEKTGEKKKEKPKKEAPKVKKEEAVARGSAVPISKKQGMYICKFIKGKEIDAAIADLNQVAKFKQAIPFKGEIPHRKGKIMSGRYPTKAIRYFISILKALKGNSIVNGLELEKTRIHEASASWAARPMRTGGRSAKRTNIILKAKEISHEQNSKGKVGKKTDKVFLQEEKK